MLSLGKAVVFAFAALFLCGCNSSPPPASQPDQHPRAELLGSSQFPEIVNVTRTPGSSPALQALGDAIANAVLLGQIGEITGSPDEVLGLVGDAVAPVPGEVIVLDSRMNELRVYDYNARLLAATGRAGEGPGEFQIPKAISMVGDTIYVADEAQRLHRFLYEDHEWKVQPPINTPIFLNDVCARPDGSPLVLGFSMEGKETLFRLAPDGNPQLSFGVPYLQDNVDLRFHFSSGHLVCSAGLVAFASEALGEVLVYTDDGSMLRAFRLPHFQGAIINFHETGRIEVHAGSAAIHSLAFVDARHLLVQMAERTEDSLGDNLPYAVLHTFLIDPTNGQSSYLGSDMDPYLASTGSGFLTSVEVPFPQIKVWQYPT